MEQLKVEFPERKPTEVEKAHEVEKVIVPTLDVLFFDGEKWFTYTATSEIYRTPRVTEDELKSLKAVAVKNLWRWLAGVLKDGEIQVNDETVMIYGVAAEPIYQEVS